MEQQNPVTLQEWRTYISRLYGADLISQAVGANSLNFLDALREEGVSNQDFVSILVMFANQFGTANVAPPSFSTGHYLSYPDLIETLNPVQTAQARLAKKRYR